MQPAPIPPSDEIKLVLKLSPKISSINTRSPKRSGSSAPSTARRPNTKSIYVWGCAAADGCSGSKSKEPASSEEMAGQSCKSDNLSTELLWGCSSPTRSCPGPMLLARGGGLSQHGEAPGRRMSRSMAQGGCPRKNKWWGCGSSPAERRHTFVLSGKCGLIGMSFFWVGQYWFESDGTNRNISIHTDVYLDISLQMLKRFFPN